MVRVLVLARVWVIHTSVLEQTHIKLQQVEWYISCLETLVVAVVTMVRVPVLARVWVIHTSVLDKTHIKL